MCVHPRQAGERSSLDRPVENHARLLEASDLEERLAVVRKQLEPGRLVFGKKRDCATEETRRGRRVPACEGSTTGGRQPP